MCNIFPINNIVLIRHTIHIDTDMSSKFVLQKYKCVHKDTLGLLYYMVHKVEKLRNCPANMNNIFLRKNIKHYKIFQL